MNFRNLDLEAFDYKIVGSKERFRVRVASSPAGEQHLAEAEEAVLPTDIRLWLRRLDKRALTLPEMIQLGESLAAALFPPRARTFLERSREHLADDEGLRIRLRLDTYALADLPWEYAYLSRPDTPASQKGLDGFLVLDRRLSLVRYEVLGQAPGSLDPVSTGPLRLVALFAGPTLPGYPALKLDVERQNTEQALAGLPDIRPEFYTNATVDTLQEALVHEAHIFHFAGHGKFVSDMGQACGSLEGKGYLVFEGDEQQPVQFSAERLALNLAGRGVRLAVLGACEGGRRDQVNAWTGVAPALTRAGIPAVVAMQYTIRDVNAIAFSKRFYRALAAGQPIDAAMTDGRLAIFNRASDDNERDWGVPVLYLRAGEGVLFPRPLPSQAGPRVINTDPSGGTVDVRRDLPSIKITFDKEMDPDRRSIGCSEGAFALSDRTRVELLPDGRTFVIARDNASELLPGNTWISFDINEPGAGNAFCDLEGNPAARFRFGFTTEAEPETPVGPRPVDDKVTAFGKRALREAMVGAFNTEDLEVLCSEVQEDLVRDGITLQVSLEMVGGSGLTAKVLNLIQYLDRRGYLSYLVAAARRARPGII